MSGRKTSHRLCRLPKSLARRSRRRLAAAVAVAAVGGALQPAWSTTYTYTPVNNPAGNDSWTAGTDWSAVPVAGNGNSLVFVASNTTVLANGLVDNNTNDIANGFVTFSIALQGTGAASGGSTINIDGDSVDVQSTTSTDSSISLNALVGASGLTYNVNTGIVLDTAAEAQTIFTGNGTATFNFNGVISGGGILAKDGTSTLTFTNTNTYTGNTTLYNGTIVLSGIAASAENSNVIVEGGSLVINNSGGTPTLPFTRAKSLTISGSSVSLTGTSAGNTDDVVINALTVGLGDDVLSITASAGANAQFSAGNLVDVFGGTLLLAGPAIGAGSIASATAGAANVVFTTAPTLSGAGASGTPTVGIVPYVVGDPSATGVGTGFVTYDANGLRLLTSNEYATAFVSGDTSGVNASVSAILSSINDATTLNSLLLSPGGAVNGSGVLTISSGAILATGANASVTNPIAFGAAPAILTAAGTSSLTLSGALTGSGGLVKAGAGTVYLGAANSLTGDTVVNNGTLTVNAANALPSGAMTIGVNTIAGTLNVNADQMIASLDFMTNNSLVINQVMIQSGATLTVNGATGGNSFVLGSPTPIDAQTTYATFTGGGTLTVNDSAGNLAVGEPTINQNDTTAFNAAKLDLSALGAFNATVNSFNVGFGPGIGATLLLSNTSNVITATTIQFGNTNGNNQGGNTTVTLGAGVNTIEADTINIGVSKSVSTVSFASQTLGSAGSLTIQSPDDSAATMNIGWTTTGTSATPTGTLNLNGHLANVTLDTLVIGYLNAQASAGGAIGTLDFNDGAFSVNTLTIGFKTNTGTGTANGTLNVAGGDFTVTGPFILGSQDTAGKSTATLGITGGLFTTDAIVNGGGGANVTDVVTLNGGTLDLTGNAIGSATAPITTLNFQTGTLQNVGEINGGAAAGAALNKTTTGTLVLAGTNTYTAATTVTAGTLNLTGSLGATSIAVNGGTFSESATGAIGSSASLTVGGGAVTLSGANPYTGATTLTAGTLIAENAAALQGSSGVTVGTGTTFEYAAPADAPLAVPGTFSLTTGAGTTLGGSIGSAATSAAVAFSGAASITGTGTVTVNIFGITGVAPLSGTNTYTLMSSASGTFAGPTYALGAIYNDTGFTVGAITGTDDALTVSITSTSALPGAYWLGIYSGAPGVWAASDGVSTSNWTTDAAGMDATPVVPSAGTNVIFSATGAANQTAMTLGANMAINSLTFNSTTASTLNNTGGYTLTIGDPTSTPTPGITVNAGAAAVTLAANVALGINQSWTNVSGNTLAVSGTIDTRGNTLTLAGTGPIALSGVISGAGGVTDTMTNSGAMVSLTGANTYTGPTTVTNLGSASYVILAFNSITNVGAGPSALGDPATVANGTINIGAATGDRAYLDYTGAAASTSDRVINITGNAAVQIENTAAGALTLTGGLTYTNPGGTDGQNLAFRGNGVITESGVIATGIAPLSFTDGGTWYLTNDANSFTGLIQVSYGTLHVTSIADSGFNSAIGAGNQINLGQNQANASGGTGILVFDGTSGGESNRSITLGNGTTGGAGVIQNSVAGTLLNLTGNVTSSTPADAASLTVGGVGNGALGGKVTSTNLAIVMNGTGVWTLTGVDTYTGATTVSSGVLQLGGAGSLGSTAVTVASNATFAVVPASAGATNSLSGTLTLNSGAVFSMVDGVNSTFTVTGASTLAPASGASATLDFEIGGATPTNDLLAFTGAATIGGAGDVFSITALPGTSSLVGPYTLVTAASGLNGPVSLASDKITVNGNNYLLSLTDTATSVVLNVSSNTSLGQLYWTGAGGSTWGATNGASTNWSISSTGTPDAEAQPGAGTDVYFVASTVASPVNTTLGANVTINSLNFTANSPAVTLGADGNTLTIDGPGGISVANGSAAQTINANLALGASQTWTNASSNLLSIAGPVATNGDYVTTAGSGPVALSGVISGGGGLIVAGGGAVAISAANTYAGSTTFQAGSNVTLTGAIGGGAVISSGTFNETSTGVIDGASSVTVLAGATTLAGANTYTGATTLTGGTLTLSGSNQTSSISINGGTNTTLLVTNPAATGGGEIGAFTGVTNAVIDLHINGGGVIALPNAIGGNSGVIATIDVNNDGDASTGGVIQLNGSSALSAIGNGTINVTGGNGYSLYLANVRDTAGGAGTVKFNPTTAVLSLGTFTAATNYAMVLDLDGTIAGNSVTGVISNGSATTSGVALTKSNTSTWTLYGANTYTGATTVTGGTLTVAGAGSLGAAGTYAGAIALSAGTSLVFKSSAAQTLTGVISGAGAIVQNGPGTLALNGAAVNTYTGPTTVNGGTLLENFANLATPTNLINSASALVLGGGTLNVTGPVNTSQSFASLALTANTASSIGVIPTTGASLSASLTIASNTPAAGAGAAMNFNYYLTTEGDTNDTSVGDNAVFWNPTLTNGIIGPGYTVTDEGGTGFATVMNVAGVGNVVVRINPNLLTELPPSGGSPTVNYLVNGDDGTNPSSTPGDLNLAETASQTVNTVTVDTDATNGVVQLGATVLSLNGMALNTSQGDFRTFGISATAGGGLKAAAAGGNLAITNSALATVTISAPILDNSTSSLTVNGTTATTLTGDNTYAGPTAIGTGTILQIGDGAGSGGSLGGGTYSAAINDGGTLAYASTEDQTLGGIISGAGGVSQSGAGGLTLGALNTYTGPTTLAASSTLTLTGTLGGGGGGTAVTSSGTFDENSTGVIAGGSSLTVLGGTTTLAGANSYVGTTTIDKGTLAMTANQNLVGGLVFGATFGSTNFGALDLSAASATFSSLTVQNSNTTANTLTIGAGKTLTINGPVGVGYSTVLAGLLNAKLAVSGGGTFTANIGTGGFYVGYHTGTGAPTGNGDSGVLDLSGTGAVNIIGSTNASNIIIGSLNTTANNTNVTDQVIGTLDLSAAGPNTVAVGTLTIGNSPLSGENGIQGFLVLGDAANNFNVDTLYVGREKTQINGAAINLMNFASPGGTLTLAGFAGGTAKTTLRIGYNDVGGTGTISQGELDLTGGTFDAQLGVVTLGYYPTSAGAGGGKGTLVMQAGTVTTDGFILASAGGSTAATSNNAGTLTLSGGSITFNAAGAGITSGTSGLGTATINLSGTGDIELDDQPITLNATTSKLTFTGGTLSNVSTYSIAGSTNLTDAGGLVQRTIAGTTTIGALNFTAAAAALSVTAGTFSTTAITTTNSSATVTLDGGVLDLNGGAIGGATAINNLNFDSGTLQNVSEINAGAALNKNTPGTLILTDTGAIPGNSYTGGTNVNNGILLANSTDTTNGSTGSGLVTVNAGGTLGGGTAAGAGQIKGNVTVNAQGFISAGDAVVTPGKLNIAGTTTLIEGAGAVASPSNGSTYLFKIASATGTAGVNWDELTLSTLTLTSGGNNVITVEPLSVGGGSIGGAISGFVSSTPSYVWPIALAQTGAFASAGNGSPAANFQLDAPALSAFAAANGVSANSFSLDTSDNGAELDLVYTNTAPEPTSLAMLALGAGALMTRRRRKVGKSSESM